MSFDDSPSTREPGRRGKTGETRARLIQAAIELVRAEGLSALTTSRITKAAGIAQPGFYAHFENTDELVRTAVSQVMEEMRVKISGARRRSFDHFSSRNELGSFKATRAVFADNLEMFLSDPSFAELLLRYRRDPSLLGGFMRGAMQRVRDDMTEDMWKVAAATGTPKERYPWVAFWAEQLLALFFVAAESLLDGRQTDKNLVLDSLSMSAVAIMRANQRLAGMDPDTGLPLKPNG